MKKITRKTLLYHSGVEYADFCLNHVEGCSHGCKYPCYAFMMKKRCGVVKTYEDWCQPKIVSNAIELLEKEIPRYKDRIEYVHLCFSTDPFMYQQQEINELSLEIIELLNRNKIRCTTLTKGIYPKELANRNRYSINNIYGVTLVSLNEKFRQQYEPNTSRFMDRINSLEYLHKKGHKTWISIEPYPTPNIIKQDIMEILNIVSFVDRIIFGRLNYSAKSSEYSSVKEYYNELANIVIDFCKNKRINFHIKHGTQIN